VLFRSKTLIKCGIVEKIYFSERDVRYFPAAYRFQEVQRMDTGTGSKTAQLVGSEVQLPREYWPVPSEYFELAVSRAATEDAITKLEQDHADHKVDDRTYDRLRRALEGEMEAVTKKLRRYADVEETMGGTRRP